MSYVRSSLRLLRSVSDETIRRYSMTFGKRGPYKNLPSQHESLIIGSVTVILYLMAQMSSYLYLPHFSTQLGKIK